MFGVFLPSAGKKRPGNFWSAQNAPPKIGRSNTTGEFRPFWAFPLMQILDLRVEEKPSSTCTRPHADFSSLVAPSKPARSGSSAARLALKNSKFYWALPSVDPFPGGPSATNRVLFLGRRGIVTSKGNDEWVTFVIAIFAGTKQRKMSTHLRNPMIARLSAGNPCHPWIAAVVINPRRLAKQRPTP